MALCSPDYRIAGWVGAPVGLSPFKRASYFLYDYRSMLQSLDYAYTATSYARISKLDEICPCRTDTDLADRETLPGSEYTRLDYSQWLLLVASISLIACQPLVRYLPRIRIGHALMDRRALNYHHYIVRE